MQLEVTGRGVTGGNLRLTVTEAATGNTLLASWEKKNGVVAGEEYSY